MLTRDKGIPREKIRFCLKKALVGNDLVLKAVADSNCQLSADPQAVKDATKELKEAQKAKDKDRVKAAQAALAAAKACKGGADGIVAVVNKLAELNQRVIGKAASFARKGDRLEVILQPRNPY